MSMLLSQLFQQIETNKGALYQAMKGSNQEKNNYVRSQILSTLLDMMKEQDIHAIVVSSLTERACVGRASFYRNFDSKEDVLRQEANRLASEWAQNYKQQEHIAPTELLISLLDFYKKHSEFYLALYQAGLADIVLSTLLEQAEISPELPNAVAYLRSSIAYLIFGWIVEWMKRGMPESGTELAEMISKAQEGNSRNGFSGQENRIGEALSDVHAGAEGS